MPKNLLAHDKIIAFIPLAMCQGLKDACDKAIGFRKSGLIICFLTESSQPSLREVNTYLKKLDTAKLIELGLELGLNITELKRIPTEQLPLELCMRWLREDDDVHETSGTPTWSSLAKALRKIGASGVASSIEQKKHSDTRAQAARHYPSFSEFMEQRSYDI